MISWLCIFFGLGITVYGFRASGRKGHFIAGFFTVIGFSLFLYGMIDRLLPNFFAPGYDVIFDWLVNHVTSLKV